MKSAGSNLTINALDKLSAADIAELPASALLDLQHDLQQMCDVAEARADRFRQALDLKFGAPAAQRLKDRGDESGKVKILEDDYVCEVEIPKTVNWDQIILTKLWDRIAASEEDPLVYMTRQLRVSETALKNWPENIQKEFRAARSYKNGRKTFLIRDAKTTDAGK